MQRVYIEYQGDKIELPVGETVVGRDVGCMLRFNDPSVSRRHLRFVRREGDVFVEDLGSSNGTRLNDRAVVAPVQIHDGDRVQVGSRALTITVAEGGFLDVPSTLIIHSADLESKPLRRALRTEMVPTLPPPLATPVDRRVHDRRAAELSIVYTSSELEIEATTRDLSISGVFVCSQVLDPIGTVCQLTFLIEGGPPIAITGVVRRVVEHTAIDEVIGLGVEFTEVGANERAWLTAFVRSVEA